MAKPSLLATPAARSGSGDFGRERVKPFSYITHHLYPQSRSAPIRRFSLPLAKRVRFLPGVPVGSGSVFPHGMTREYGHCYSVRRETFWPAEGMTGRRGFGGLTPPTRLATFKLVDRSVA